MDNIEYKDIIQAIKTLRNVCDQYEVCEYCPCFIPETNECYFCAYALTSYGYPCYWNDDISLMQGTLINSALDSANSTELQQENLERIDPDAKPEE